MKLSAPALALALAATALTAVVSHALGDDGLHRPSIGGMASSISVGDSGATVAAPVVAITVPAASPEAASTTPETVSGTTTGTVTSCAWATAPASGAGACSTGAGTFSCAVTQAQDAVAAQTVTVSCTGPGGVGTDTTDLVFPAFQMLPGSTTPNDLPDALTINATPMTLVLACDAEDVSGASWPCRTASGTETLTRTAGTCTTSSETPFVAFDSTERIAGCTSGARWATASTTLGDIGTDDLVVEWVGATSGANAQVQVSTSTLTASNVGWGLYMQTSGMRLSVADGVANPTGAFSLGRAAGFFGHSMHFVDRSENSTNGSFGYANGIQGSGANMSTASGAASSSQPITFFSDSDGSQPDPTGRMASVRIWRCAGCMPGGASNPAEWLPIAKERTAIAFGVAPVLAAGLDAPTTMTRAASGFIDVEDGGVRSLYMTSLNAPRVCKRGSTVGYLSEPQTTNLCLQSQTFDSATWTATNLSRNADLFVAPDGTTTADRMTNASTVTPQVTQPITVSASTVYTGSFYAKANTGSTWVMPFIHATSSSCSTGTAADCFAWVDLSTCTLGVTASAGLTQRTVEDWGNGWCRIILTGTTQAGATSSTVGIRSVTGDGAVAGNNGDIWIPWGAEFEAFPTTTSYTPTTTASVTRSADDLRFDGASHYTGSPTTMETAWLCPSYDQIAAAATFASVGVDANNRILEQGVAASDRANSYGRTASVDQWSIVAAAGDVSDGSAHTLRSTMVTNDIEAFYDGVSIGTDVAASLSPTASSGVFFGTSVGTAAQPACLITNLRLWSRDVTPAEAP